MDLKHTRRYIWEMKKIFFNVLKLENQQENLKTWKVPKIFQTYTHFSEDLEDR